MSLSREKTGNTERVYDLLEGSWQSSIFGRAINLFMIVLISANVLVVILYSVPDFRELLQPIAYPFELFSIVVFSIEYLLRLWCCVAAPAGMYSHPVKGRLKWMATPLALIDLAAVAPFYLSLVVPGLDLRFLRAFRIVRLLKLTRYFPAMSMLGRVVSQQGRALASAALVMFILLIIASNIMYLIERDAQPEHFASIPAAMWWGVATLTTVGYGDVVPVTTLGRIVGAFIAVFGIGMFALPAAILASGFAREMEKSKFIVSWRVVANVPLFSKLNAGEIAEVAALLQARSCSENEIVFRTGAPAHSMFFIVSGRVQIDIGQERFVLDEGDFFGEIALLHDRVRAGTATCIEHSQLLELSKEAFARLCERQPSLYQNLNKIADNRRRDFGRGDLAS